MEEVVGEMTLAGRVEIWNRALYAIQDFPFTGCGLGTFRRVVQVLYPLFLAGPDSDVAHAHNIFLQTALDLGLPGLVAYLALLAVAWATCWRWARQGGPLVRSVALGLAAGLVGLHIYGLADAVALGSKPGAAFWMALGLVAALNQAGEQDAGELGDGEPASVSLASSVTHYFSDRRWLIVVALLFGVVLLAIGAFLGWRVLQDKDGSPEQPAVRLPIYPDAQGLDVRTETPPANSDWVGLLEVATFTTTHSITGVVTFYTGALAEGGWETNIEAGDATSWGGIYTQDGGRSVCLLNVFAVEGEVWVSAVCGDKAEPVDLPRSSLPSAQDAAALPADILPHG